MSKISEPDDQNTLLNHCQVNIAIKAGLTKPKLDYLPTKFYWFSFDEDGMVYDASSVAGEQIIEDGKRL